VDIDGVIYLVKMADCVYRVSTNNHSEATGALIDQGANGGIAGNDCRVIEVNDQPHRYVNVEGIDGHVMEQRRLFTAGAVTHSNCGPVILIMHQYAHSEKGHSIHSSPQLEWTQASTVQMMVMNQEIEVPMDAFIFTSILQGYYLFMLTVCGQHNRAIANLYTNLVQHCNSFVRQLQA
jgi:hypothetical protein